ncbi:hypothetical protein BCV69DRAFT_145485 [Microstroma glucosiphilum]|uniref:SET domain-containing protein n=1 Tax=Pseudomicrostroma glucosiphilum TaxID=1684307 RepID=A0A316UH47_9BASI|nr:hypothetical protein BCV69DRAFT_145485 [Pseudomicrostroma glucosiphilum]PWN22495.1 hypothetical protein BCV69DRAFT_145485 [Pseudomicrostroma glucosiphilum]
MITSDDADHSVDGYHIDGVDSAALAISQWLREHGIWLHPSLTIQPLDNDSHIKGLEKGATAKAPIPRALGVFLSPTFSPLPIPSGRPIALIPKPACLSPRTSALRTHLTTLDIDPVFGPQATSGLLLSFCLLYEKYLGQRSVFYGYVRSLPRERPGGQFGICLPLEGGRDPHIPSDTVLPGTETARLLQRAELLAEDPASAPGWPSHSSDAVSLSLLWHFHTQTVLPFLVNLDLARDKAPSESAWSEFLGCYSLVSSRAFVCDTYHGLALVPLADIFNHAEPAEEDQEDDEIQQHVQFECEDLVCTRCGSLTHSETGKCRKSCKSSDRQKPSLHVKDTDVNDEDEEEIDDDLIYMTTIVPLYASPTRPLEIFNNYGPLSPARLLASYGFVAESGPVNKWERYCWDWRSSVERAEVLTALGLDLEEEIEKASSRKRSYHGEEPVDEPKIHGESYDARRRWSRLVDTLAARGTQAMEPLFPSSESIHASNEAQNDPGRASGPDLGPVSRILPLPKQSPFALMDLPAVIGDSSALLVSPSADEEGYTADEILPLFIDGRGKVSRPLWTVCVLAALVRSTSRDGSSSLAEWSRSKEGLLQLLKSVEERAEAKIAGHPRPEEGLRSTPVKEEQALQTQILASAASMLHALVQARQDSIPVSIAELEATAAKDDSLRSGAIRLAHNERLILLQTLNKVKRLLSIGDTSSQQMDEQDSIVFEKR